MEQAKKISPIAESIDFAGKNIFLGADEPAMWVNVEGLSQIVKGITGKGGVKMYDKVNRRIGGLAQKYPSVLCLQILGIPENTNFETIKFHFSEFCFFRHHFLCVHQNFIKKLQNS